MNKINLYLILVLCTIWIEKIAPQNICNTTSSLSYGVKWPSTSNRISSEPPCVNEAHELSYRECCNGYWSTEPDCCYIQSETPPQCPEGFIDADEVNICYKVSSQKSKFPPKCPFEDVLAFDDYKNLIANIGPVWMPVRRDVSNGLGFLQWIEASYLYRSSYNGTYVWKTVKDKDCLLYHNNSYIEAVSCDEKHSSACAYKKLNKLTDYLCNSEDLCHRSDFTAKSKCFCLGTASQQSYPKAEFLKPYQNHVYGMLTNETCAMGLEKLPNGTYIWSNSKQEISYTYWSADAVFDDSHIYGASTPKGWILTEEPGSCILFEKEVQMVEPVLELTFNDSSSNFILTVTHPRGLKRDGDVLLYCFTDAVALNLLYKYPVFNQTQNSSDPWVFNFEPLEDGPGQYWCESFNYFNLEVVPSNKIFLRQQKRFQYEFVSIFKTSYPQNINPLSEDMISVLEKTLLAQLSNINYMRNYTVRIMKILDVDETNHEIYVNIHITSKTTDMWDRYDQNYQQMKALMEEIFNQTEMVAFSTADLCMAETTRLFWPRTAIGNVATPQEFCFKSDGVRFRRACEGDFTNGARWATIDENCEIFNTSSVTPDLIFLINASDQEIISNLKDIFKNETQFFPVDLYLVGEIFTSLSSSDNIDLDQFSEIINNLLDIDKSIFQEAQLKMRATDKILYAMDRIINKNAITAAFQGKNFHLVAGSTTEFCGVIVSKDDHKITHLICSNIFSIENVINQVGTNAESIILLSQDLAVKIEGINRVIFTIFLKDSLFNEKSSAVETSGTVFKVMLSHFHEILPAPIWTLQSVQNGSTNACSSWNYNVNPYIPGSWSKDSDANDSYSPFLFCEFWHTTHFTLTSVSAKDVTESLVDILESESTAAEVISKLHTVSAKYDEFVSSDLYLVGKILERVNEDREIDLKAFAGTVSNLHLIPKEVLLESQVEKGATDMILHYIDKIVMNHNYQTTIEVISDNFMILITDKRTNFSGLVLLECDEIFQLQILDQDVEIEEVANYKNLNSAVVLNSELKNQLEEDAKVIITLFSNDALFNDKKSQSKYVSKIFGVILPSITEYSGPVSVLYKAAKNDYQAQCSHWSYNKTLMGSWLKDQDAKHLNSVINCEFWHTTHFSLLLLSQDYQDEVHNDILDWITNVTCIISLFSLFCIIFTAILFKKWRSNTGNKILLNFVFVLILQMGLFYFSNRIRIDGNAHDHLLCTITGVVLHYSIISEFCWMLVIGFLQYHRFVKVLEGPPKYILLKSCICGWFLPLFPVISVLLSDHSNYVHNTVGLCYPSGLGLYLGVWLPISLIISINVIIFISIIYSVIRKQTECGDVGYQETVLQWRLAILLFFLLGLTWIFGFLSQMDFGIVFLYLFTITATLQGFMLFLFFIVFNSNTKYLYLRAFKRCFCKEF